MSLAHVRLRQTADDDAVAEYSVESPDFDPTGEWRQVGTLRLEKKHAEYDFTPGDAWLTNRILPPKFYELDELERADSLESQYVGYGGGAWAMIVHHYATTLLEG